MTLPRVLICVLLSMLAPLMARSQNSFGHVKNYGSSDGLPSPETYFVKEDLKGYLWVGTDRGLSRYDGYTFKNFTSGNSALTNNTIFNVYESPAGNLWFACYDGSITIYDPVKELFTPFKGNDSLKKWFKYWPAHVAFNEDTAVIFEYNVFNECAVFVNQTIKRQAYTSFDSITSIYFEDINAYRTLFDAFYASKRHLFANKVGRINTIADSSLRLRFEYVVSRKGSSFFYYDYNLYELRNGHVSVYERFDHPIQHIGLDQYGRLMASTEGGAYVETNTGFSEVLKGRMISDVSQDIEGNYWVASLDNGIYKIPDIGAVHHMKLDYPVNSLLGDGTHLFMGGADQILVYEASSRKIKTVRDKVSRSPKTLRINEFDKNRGKVLTGAHHLLTHDKDVGLQRFFDDSRFKRSIYLGHGQILAAGAYNGLYFLNELDSTIVYNADFDQVITGFDEDETDTVWIGTLNSGMWYTLRDKLLKPKQLKHPDGPKDRITEVLHTSDNTRIFGTISSGVFLLRNGQMKQLSVEDGLISEVVNALTLESDSVLWVGTNKGLNKLHLEDNLENCRVLYSLNADDGLPYSYIYCLEFWRNKLYLGVERGVLEIIPDRLKPLPVKPRMDIGQIQIAQTSGHPAGDMVFKHFQNDISIDYVGISFNKPESDFYRYRLLYSGDDDTSYRYTSNTSIDFLNLAPGSYQFEVACRDKNNNWSKTKTYSFEITPHYTDTIWFKVSVVAFVIIFLLLIIVWQYKEIKRKNEKEKKLRDLELKFKESELAILRNQMNPHFVFNALNSIQSYILQSDPETASGYVQRFSVLMRSSLEYTMDDWISLRKEIDFLANYLHVEKLRFPDRFSFKITHSEEIDPEEINIPPLLIQPLVENCVKHAFSPDENGGLIKVHFELEADKIRCTVEDNGIGIVKKKARSRIKHRSYGIEVVQNRLELLDDEESGQYLEYHDLGETEEEGTGTRVLVLIPIE